MWPPSPNAPPQPLIGPLSDGRNVAALDDATASIDDVVEALDEADTYLIDAGLEMEG